jgi:CRP/FNR family transcriptional regulator
MSAGSVERRLAALLQHLLDRFGDELEDGETVIQVALSRAELASLVGATLETTIRMMSRWRREGIVSTTTEGFVVHAPERLDEILNTSAFSASSGRAPEQPGEEHPLRDAP